MVEKRVASRAIARVGFMVRMFTGTYCKCPRLREEVANSKTLAHLRRTVKSTPQPFAPTEEPAERPNEESVEKFGEDCKCLENPSVALLSPYCAWRSSEGPHSPEKAFPAPELAGRVVVFRKWTLRKYQGLPLLALAHSGPNHSLFLFQPRVPVRQPFQRLPFSQTEFLFPEDLLASHP